MNMYIGNNNATPVCNVAVLGTCKFPNTPGNTTPADTRQYHVHVYFVAPCSIGSGANGICLNTDPRQPTLKQLSLSTDGAIPTMVITPLVEGIEYFQVEYGLDTVPTAINPVTGQAGDGVPDNAYTGAPTAAQWGNVVSVRIYLLARSPRSTDDYTDTKQYQLAGTAYGAFNDNFKRHAYNTEVRPVNVAGRREIP
jgi:type IV pilus assembly protein PilW